MDRFVQDLRFAFRSLRSSPLLTAASITSLALGIGASAAIFSAVDTFLLKPLEFEDSDRLVTVWSNNLDRGWTQMSTSPVDFRDWRREATSLELVAMTSAGVNMATDDGAIHLTTGGRRGEVIRIHWRPGQAWAVDDLTTLAAGGPLWLYGDDDRPPVRVAAPQAFHHAAAEAGAAALVALFERHRSGRGQHVDVSAQQAVTLATQSDIVAAAVGEEPGSRFAGGAKLGPLELKLVFPAKA